MSGRLVPGEFACLRCGMVVSGAFELSGVRSRNHCPYCLWSRHLDWRGPGDRLSSCKGAMRPIALTLKKSRNRYAAGSSGELMVVHACTACAKVAINRIAGDDMAESLVDVFRASLAADDRLRAEMLAREIRLLDLTDWGEISRRLFGEVRPFDGFRDCSYDVSSDRSIRAGRNPP